MENKSNNLDEILSAISDDLEVQYKIKVCDKFKWYDWHVDCDWNPLGDTHIEWRIKPDLLEEAFNVHVSHPQFSAFTPYAHFRAGYISALRNKDND